MNSKLFLALMASLVLLFAGTSSGQHFIEIDKPLDGGEVTWIYTVEGDSSTTVGSGLKAYVLVWPNEAFGPWWVQETNTNPDGSWKSQAYFGRGTDEDIGTTYSVIAILTEEELNPGQRFADIPDHEAKSDPVTVTRVGAIMADQVPTEDYFVDIGKPQDNGEVSWMYTLQGNSSATVNSGLKVYVLVWPNEAFGPWWVQETETVSNGSWRSYAYFGRGRDEDIGTAYTVIAVATDEELRAGQRFTDLPPHVGRSDQIEVTRTGAGYEWELLPKIPDNETYVEIIKPQDGGNVSWMYTVGGNYSAKEASGLNAYLLVWPKEAFGPWWVQDTETYSDGLWLSNVYFGEDPRIHPEHIGTTYGIVAILTDQELESGQRFRDLPDYVWRSNIFGLTRTEASYEWELPRTIPLPEPENLTRSDIDEVAGDIQITLNWPSGGPIALGIVTPNDDTIWCIGSDIFNPDVRVVRYYDNESEVQAETVYWKKGTIPPKGEYSAFVYWDPALWDIRPESTSFDLSVAVKGKETEDYADTIHHSDVNRKVATMTYP